MADRASSGSAIMASHSADSRLEVATAAFEPIDATQSSSPRCCVSDCTFSSRRAQIPCSAHRLKFL